jgi:hypothetical protein
MIYITAQQDGEDILFMMLRHDETSPIFRVKGRELGLNPFLTYGEYIKAYFHEETVEDSIIVSSVISGSFRDYYGIIDVEEFFKIKE